MPSFRTLACALVFTFIACSSFFGCVSTEPPTTPTDVTRPSNSGLCGDGWSATASLTQARFLGTATRLGDGTVVAAGGFFDDGAGNSGVVPAAERFDPNNNNGTWRPAGTLNVPRYWHRAVWLKPAAGAPAAGKVLVVGGYTDSGPTETAEIYDPANNTWSLAAPMHAARWVPQVTALSDGRVLVSGGLGNAGQSLASAEIYNPGTNTWSTNTPSMSKGRYFAGTALLPGGKVMVAGGNNGGGTGSPSDYESSAEIFDPSAGTAGTWSNAPSMSVARYGLGMAALQDGRVMAVGGTDAYPGAEIYDPVARTWSPTPDMAQVPRFFFETLALADGRVLVAGGSGSAGYLDGAEMFDVGLGRWTQIDSMSTSRYQALSAELLDGRILVAGGQTITNIGVGLVTGTAETYLPCPPNYRPIAVCQNRTISAGPTCTGAAVSVNVPLPPNTTCDPAHPVGTCDPDNFPGSLTITETPGAPFTLGNTTVTLTASDGNLAGTCSATVSVVDTTPPTITCPDDDPNVPGNQVYLECVNGGATGRFTATATDNCSVTSVTCSPSSATLPVGTSTRVTCTATDGSKNPATCDITAIVRDTKPPTTGTSRGMLLWPADGLLHEITLMDCANFTVDACYGRMNPLKDYGTITYVTSDEPDNLPGGSDGNTTPDIQIKKPWLALVRAERDTTKNGRVYTLHYISKDPSGNTASGACTVGVPKNQNSDPVDDTGAGFCIPNTAAGYACP